MPRVKRGTTTHRRHAALLERAKGYRTGRHKLVRRATEAVLKAGQYAYRDRRAKKRDLRRGWIVTINAAARQHGVSYSVLMNRLTAAGSGLDRKVLAEIARSDAPLFESIVSQAVGK